MRFAKWFIAATLLLWLSAGPGSAQTSALTVELLNRVEGQVDADADRLIGIFKDIHAHPELGFMEERTAGIVADEPMVEDGLFTDQDVPVPEYLLGLHTAPIPTGTVIGSGGVLMAGTEQIMMARDRHSS